MTVDELQKELEEFGTHLEVVVVHRTNAKDIRCTEILEIGLNQRGELEITVA